MYKMNKVINLRKHRRFKLTKGNNDIIKRKKKPISHQNIDKILITIISILSIFLGCIIFKLHKADSVTEFENLVSFFQKENFLHIILFFMKYELLLFLVEFFIGTSMIGTPLVVFPPIIKCVFIGCFSSFMYNQFEVKGILFCLMLLYPFYAITTSSLIFAANESAYMSKNLFSTTIKKKTLNDMSTNIYLIRYLFLIVLNIVCTVINSFLIVTVAPRFNLN